MNLGKAVKLHQHCRLKVTVVKGVLRNERKIQQQLAAQNASR